MQQYTYYLYLQTAVRVSGGIVKYGTTVQDTRLPLHMTTPQTIQNVHILK